MMRRIDGNALRSARVRAGYSNLDDLARQVGWSSSQLRRVEKGRRNASQELYDRIINVLGLTDGALLVDDDTTGSAA